LDTNSKTNNSFIKNLADIKSVNLEKLLLIISIIIVLVFNLLSIITALSFSLTLSFYYIIITSSLLFVITYFTFRYILKQYIFEKIKLIYKTIHTLKMPKNEKRKNNTIDLRKDVFSSVSHDVKEWANNNIEEIDNLKKLETYRREFLGNVSHELKTPIFNIQGYILTLADGAINDPEVNMDYLQKTEKNIERLIAIVEDLGVISQLESGDSNIDYVRFDIASLSREIFELLETKASSRNIRFTFHDAFSTDKNVYVFADKEKIRQVLINLLDNSIKYGIEGGRTKISFYDMDENILIEVSDNGIGIETLHIPRLFERFYRVDKSRSRNQGGSGLGLAIVKHIIESHEQTINVRSAPGVGSTFSFTLKKAN